MLNRARMSQPLLTTVSTAVIPPAEELAAANERLSEMAVQLRHALREKDAFLAGMSHELRTPLSSIVGFTDTLLMGLHGSLNADQKRHLQTIQRSSEHLLSLINDLLDLSKIAAGPIEMRPEPLDCRDVLDEIVSVSAPLAASKQLGLTALAPESELIVRADRRGLRQILLNLVSNAIKFTERGAVELRCRAADENGNPCAIWEVADTGEGLCAEDLEKLFRPFVQLAPDLNQPRGTGLGLHLSLKLAQQMHGTLRVESRMREGSTFSLVLPLSPPDCAI